MRSKLTYYSKWSRLSGGSGAPTWTLYAAGLNPKSFKNTQAALVHNTWDNPAEFPKMLWCTNYTRLACQTMFTLFWAGRDFAPKAIIDGVNIQDYLQSHFIAACKYLAQRIHNAGDLEGDVVIGWESINEPHKGLIGTRDISSIPSEQHLQLGTSPTAFQAMLISSGRPCEVKTWSFGKFGPYQSGTEVIDPKGEQAWLSAEYDDYRYGWHRDPGWKLGECIWAQHGVWDSSKSRPSLLQKDYFSRNPQTGEILDYERFTNTYFLNHYRAYKDAIRSVCRTTIMFCQPPVMELPPTLKGTVDDDPNMVHAAHFYDGLTLLTKHWLVQKSHLPFVILILIGIGSTTWILSGYFAASILHQRLQSKSARNQFENAYVVNSSFCATKVYNIWVTIPYSSARLAFRMIWMINTHIRLGTTAARSKQWMQITLR